MNRKPRFLIGLVSAIITFSVLLTVVGKPKYFEKCHLPKECNTTKAVN